MIDQFATKQVAIHPDGTTIIGEHKNTASFWLNDFDPSTLKVEDQLYFTTIAKPYITRIMLDKSVD